MRRIALILTLAFLILPAVPAAGESGAEIEQADCASMTVRLEPSVQDGTPVPNEYVFRTAPSPENCTWRTVVAGPPPASQTLSATVSIDDIFRGSGSCDDGSACWPVLCQGFLTDGSLDVRAQENGGFNRSTNFRADDTARINHINPGNGISTILSVQGMDKSGAIVAISGNFVRSGGDCAGGTAAGWVEFEGSLVAFDPPLPELPVPTP